MVLFRLGHFVKHFIVISGAVPLNSNENNPWGRELVTEKLRKTQKLARLAHKVIENQLKIVNYA